MKRLLALSLLAPTLVVAGPVSAAPPTCLENPATIVGDPGRTVRGTSGDDVIVTAGASVVTRLEGDDIICVTGDAPPLVTVAAGPGDDDVRVMTRRHPQTFVDLGPGADTFVGGPGDDEVFADADHDDASGVGPGRDVIRTGAGRDVVEAGAPGAPFVDDVSSAGDLFVEVTGTGLGAGGAIVFGEGGSLTLTLPEDPVAIDVPTARVVDPVGAEWRWSGSPTSFWVRGPSRVDFRGTAADEILRIEPAAFGTIVGAAGDDRLELFKDTAGQPPAGASYDGGPGRDGVSMLTGAVVADLRAGVLALPGPDVLIPEVENVYLTAGRVRVLGDDRPNVIWASGCTVSVRGGSGPDVIGAGAVDSDGFDPYFEPGSDCPYDARVLAGPGADRVTTFRGDDVVRGGAGNDRIEGRDGDDVLDGGPGRDRIDGGKDRDRCTGEREKRCER